MDKSKSIIVKQNGKVTNIVEHKGKNIQSSNRESAATLQESEDDLIPTYERKTDLKKVKPRKKQSKFSMFKPILIAIASAVVIGSLLSVIMFQFFVNVEADLTGQSLFSAPATNTDEEVAVNDIAEKAETSVYSMESINVFVSQAGVFSERVNAEEWAKNFQEIGIPSVIWERDNQYFLLIGVSGTKEQAESVSSELDTGDFDIFVKEWSTISYEVELTEDEYQWLESFRESYMSAVQIVGENSPLTATNWDTNLEGSDKISVLLDEIKGIEDISGLKAQQVLLNLLLEYENLANK